MTITFDADDVAYFDEVHGRRSEALCPKPLQVVFRDGDAARPNDCHANAVRWAAQTPDAIPVHGWLIEAQDAFQLHIVAHSVVADEHGRLIDVTPNREKSSRSDTGAVILRQVRGSEGGGGGMRGCPAPARLGRPSGRRASGRLRTPRGGRTAPEAYGARMVTV